MDEFNIYNSLARNEALQSRGIAGENFSRLLGQAATPQQMPQAQWSAYTSGGGSGVSSGGNYSGALVGGAALGGFAAPVGLSAPANSVDQQKALEGTYRVSENAAASNNPSLPRAGSKGEDLQSFRNAMLQVKDLNTLTPEGRRLYQEAFGTAPPGSTGGSTTAISGSASPQAQIGAGWQLAMESARRLAAMTPQQRATMPQFFSGGR